MLIIPARGYLFPLMGSIGRSAHPASSAEKLFAEHPVLTLDTWVAAIGGPRGAARAKAAAKYYARTSRLRRLTRGLNAVVPPGQDPQRFTPDPYLVAAALRGDAVLSRHTALDRNDSPRPVWRGATLT